MIQQGSHAHKQLNNPGQYNIKTQGLFSYFEYYITRFEIYKLALLKQTGTQRFAKQFEQWFNNFLC